MGGEGLVGEGLERAGRMEASPHRFEFYPKYASVCPLFCFCMICILYQMILYSDVCMFYFGWVEAQDFPGIGVAVLTVTIMENLPPLFL